MYFTGCARGGALNSTTGSEISETLSLNGYVYRPAEGQSRGKAIQEKAIQNTGLLVSSSQLSDKNYTPVNNATIKREDIPFNSTKTDSNGAFAFSNLTTTTGEYNIIIDPSTSTNASNYACAIECFGVYNTSTSQQAASIKVVPVNTTIPLGKKRQFRIIMKDDNANVIPPCVVTWSVEGNIGTIDSGGIFTATRAGYGRIVATYEGFTSFSDVRVIGEQQTGSLRGIVSDGSIVVDGIVIKIENIQTIGNTNEIGEYTIPEIPAGNYTVYATQNGQILTQQDVIISAGQTTECNFTISPIPYISEINPLSALTGSFITITGKYFGKERANNYVSFNNIQSIQYNEWSNTRIICKIPDEAITGNVAVAVANQRSNAIIFTVTGNPVPIINSINPANGNQGNSVTISGSNLGSSQRTSTVTFNGVGASISSWNDTQIVCTVPAGASTGPVIATIGGQASNNISFGVLHWQTATVDSTGEIRETSIALDLSGNPHISYYTYIDYDLKYARWDGASWQIQTVDSSGNVGRENSIVVDSAGNPHISYYKAIDGLTGHLKYARWDGASWQIQTVDSSGNAGYSSSIALDSGGNPYISYYDSHNNNLKYARWNGSSWNIEVIDSAVYAETSIALDSSSCPNISYLDYLAEKSVYALKYARWNGSSWDIKIVEEGIGISQELSIALNSSGYPYISYHVTYNGGKNWDLALAKWNGSSWQIEIVESGATAKAHVGSYPSIAIDSADNIHIGYQDRTNYNLKYAKWNGSSWKIETIDSTGEVGYYTSIAVDSNGYPHISYQDWGNKDLKYAKFGP